MKLITTKLRETLPPIGATKNLVDPTVYAKLFDPCGSWTWYVIEFDGSDLAYGLVQGFEEELGYFSISELESIQNDWGLGIERDRTFEPKLLSVVRET